jgi:16S rRNA (uracil1498-N3)-methyltransferase
VLLHEAAGPRMASLRVPRSGDVVLVVGPEGGTSDEERAAFEAAGAVAVRLGPSVLRTSTAGTVAAAVVLASCGRWD